MNVAVRLLAGIVIAVSLVSVACAEGADQGVTTKARFALQLVNTMKLALPADFSQMTAEQQFQTCVTLLSGNGVTAFTGSQANDVVTRDFAVDTLITLVADAPATVQTTAEKTDFLVSRGVLPAADTLSENPGADILMAALSVVQNTQIQAPAEVVPEKSASVIGH